MSKLANNGNRRTYINCVNQKRKKKKLKSTICSAQTLSILYVFPLDNVCGCKGI